ncbi:MAG: OmpH family outer membrane protein [Chitinophagales bacterium]
MLKKVVVLIAVVMTLGGTSYAQTLKLGYINSLELLSLMPAVATADKQLEAYATGLDNTLETMYKEYETKIKDYQKNEKMWPPSTLEIKQKELMDLEKRIGEFEQTIQRDINKKRESLYAPILEKADVAIKAVATEGNYTYIFDASTGSLLFADEAQDILPKVKAKLGL